tara:strand:+ start:1080 stop:2069 length:990 start_codon:yes stop_codon:yes gene_type:complete
MIVKNFEINKVDLKKFKFFLLYGNNKGFIEETINLHLKNKLSKNIYTYEENTILKEIEQFKETVFNKSFFETDKLIIISRTTDKILKVVEEIFNKNVENTYIILISNVLEKKSKLRNFFEKEKNIITIPFYEDNDIALSSIAQTFLREKKIDMSRENINLLIERSRGDRINLKNELEKIESFSLTRKKIQLKDIMEISNLADNYSISELVDSSLSRNKKKTLNILNENNFVFEDCIYILRTFLSKLKRLLKLQEKIKNHVSIDAALSSFKPPIFWKDKEVVKSQIKNLNYQKIQKLIVKINNVELLVKKNPTLSIKILTNFILELPIRS